MERTELAAGEVVGGTILSVWLVQPADKPESVVVMWAHRRSAWAIAGVGPLDAIAAAMGHVEECDR